MQRELRARVTRARQRSVSRTLGAGAGRLISTTASASTLQRLRAGKQRGGAGGASTAGKQAGRTGRAGKLLDDGKPKKDRSATRHARAPAFSPHRQHGEQLSLIHI